MGKESQMAKSEFRSKESMGFIIKSRMDLMKTWDKKDALALMLPQRVEKGILYNFRDAVIGGCDGKDVVFHEDETIITETNRITDKFLNTFYAPMEAYFGASEETEDDTVEDDTVEDDTVEDDTVEDETVEDVDTDSTKEETEMDLVTEIEILIENDELKKAKKVLKANKDSDLYKKAKKILKKAQ